MTVKRFAARATPLQVIKTLAGDWQSMFGMSEMETTAYALTLWCVHWGSDYWKQSFGAECLLDDEFLRATKVNPPGDVRARMTGWSELLVRGWIDRSFSEYTGPEGNMLYPYNGSFSFSDEAIERIITTAESRFSGRPFYVATATVSNG